MTTKTTDENESSVDNSSAQKNKKNNPLSPPSRPPKEDSDSDSDMGYRSAHIPLYEGDEDPRRHWFVYESTWEANQVTDEDRQMVQFAGALRKRELKWFMTFSERTPGATKAEVKAQFLSFFKTQDAKHLEAKKLKTTSQTSGEIVCDYDKRWKDLLSQLDYVIDEKLLIQWFLVVLSQKIRQHISLETFKTYEDALTKALQVEMDEDIPTYSTDHRLEEQLEIVQKYLKELNLKSQDIWCTKCSTMGHLKDNCRQNIS